MLQFIFLDSFWSSEVHWNTFIKRGRSASSVVWRPYRPDWHLSMRTSSSTPLLSYLSVVLLCADSSFMPHRRKPLYPLPPSFPVRTSSIPFTSSSSLLSFSLVLSLPFSIPPSSLLCKHPRKQTNRPTRLPELRSLVTVYMHHICWGSEGRQPARLVLLLYTTTGPTP